jgi:hypothetical protein
MKQKTNATKSINDMSAYELCRWAALIQAVNLVGDHCDDRKKDFEKIDFKPIYLYDYIDQTADKIYAKFV